MYYRNKGPKSQLENNALSEQEKGCAHGLSTSTTQIVQVLWLFYSIIEFNLTTDNYVSGTNLEMLLQENTLCQMADCK